MGWIWPLVMAPLSRKMPLLSGSLSETSLKNGKAPGVARPPGIRGPFVSLTWVASQRELAHPKLPADASRSPHRVSVNKFMQLEYHNS